MYPIITARDLNVYDVYGQSLPMGILPTNIHCKQLDQVSREYRWESFIEYHVLFFQY